MMTRYIASDIAERAGGTGLGASDITVRRNSRAPSSQVWMQVHAILPTRTNVLGRYGITGTRKHQHLA